MMNAGESVPNAFLMREKRVDENSAKAVLTVWKKEIFFSVLCVSYTHTRW